MKEYTIIANCNLTTILAKDDVEDGVDVESIVKSNLYKTCIKNIIKADTNVDDVDITGVKVFVRDLEGGESDQN